MKKSYIKEINSVSNTTTVQFHVKMTDGQLYSVAWVESSWNIMPRIVMYKDELVDGSGNNVCLGTSIMNLDDVQSVVWLLANDHVYLHEIQNMSKYKLNKILRTTD